MQFVTCGLPQVPLELTRQGIYALSFHEHERIRDRFFVIQVIEMKLLADKNSRTDIKKHYVSAQIEVSDGIGSATALVQKNILDELTLYEQSLSKNCIIIMKGDIFRQRFEDGKTAFIFNETPRLVINEIAQVIGEPTPLIKACESNRYDDIKMKYHKDFFKIPYNQSFYNKYVSKDNMPLSNQEQMLELVDRIAELPPSKFKNKSIFPRLTDTDTTFTILSYAFYLHKSKVLLRRLSRTGLLMGTCAEDSSIQFDKFQKKIIEIPIYSNQTLVVKTNEFQKSYKLIESMDYLTQSHQDFYALRTISPIINMSTFKNMRLLNHPFAFNPLISANGAEDLMSVLKLDQLEELSFEIKYDNPEYATAFKLIRESQHLKKLVMNVTLKKEMIELLNKNLTREMNIKYLQINFTNNNQTDSMEIKFPKYLKNLQGLFIQNICDKNFTETMFDMASQRRLKELALSFQHEMILPNFSEALQKFTNLQSLALSRIPFQKINQEVFLDFVSQGASQLKLLYLDSIQFTDDQFKQLLEQINKNANLREFKLQQVHLDSDMKIDFLKSFLASNKYLRKVTLSENMLQNLDLMSYMYINKVMKELCIWNQSYFKEKGKLEQAEIVQTKENKSIEYLNFSLGLMTTIKPLVKCLCTFTRLKDLRISNVNLSKLHFMAIDNYLIANSNLQKLTLMNVKMGHDQFMVLAGTVRNSRRLRKLNLSSNQLKNQGCLEVATVLLTNQSIQTLNLDNNEIKEHGLVALLKVLEQNKTLVKLTAENNTFQVTRGLLSLLGNVLIYRNRTLRQLILTCYGKVMLRREQENNEEFDREMIVRFIEELKVKSNLKVLTI